MLAAYRATGADPPFGDPRGYHGAGHGGPLLAHHPAAHRCRGGRHPRHLPRRAGPSVGDGLAGRPPGRRGAVGDAARGVGRAAAGCGCAPATRSPPTSTRCASTSAPTHGWTLSFAEPLAWPRRAFGALGPAQVVPGLSQYWHPWLLRAQVSGSARVGARDDRPRRRRRLRREELGRGRHAAAWWWGQAHGFDRPDVCVAFAGGRAGLGALRTTATALVVAVGDEVRTVVRPLRPLRVTVDERGWRLAGAGDRGRGPRRRRARTSCRSRSRASAGAWTTGRPSTWPATLRAERAPPRAHALSGHVASSRASSAAAGTSASRAAGSPARPSRCRRGP